MVSIQGYFIKEELYNGSRTVVYRGVRDSDAKPVVIKLLKNPYPHFNELLQFRNQYTIAKNLEIPGIVRLYNLEAYGNSYALVMEDCGGISLHEYMKTKNLASVEDILSITLKVSDILHKLHQNRVIHKDIKPANILINPQTKEIKLIDFSIASLLPKETQEIKNPNSLEGTLVYLSPEQTGRMNRGVDYRSDFYSLGVTFYKLLTGELPFKSDDAMELVHCHIAKKPPSINSEKIPQVISDIVRKLMAKNAEDRYQSAWGLKYDLEICLRQFKETGHIQNFPIAQRDICDRFIIPEKLYGRENEVKELLAAFDRVINNQTELILVAGFSGIGKTAIVNEVHKPIVRQRGYFIKGKFDQFNRNIPFSAFVQAFRNLMGQLLSEADVQLSNWKDKILQALGENGQVIIDVIPELEQIIGKQPPVAELSGTAAQNRFNLLFQKFIQVFTTREHPLVIFLDDLQWADSASLKLMQLLMSESENNYLLVIGAYRDNEVFSAHPLMLTLEEISKSEAIINTINLAALNEASLNDLVADTLNCLPLTAKPLTQLVSQKTKGNPFFSTQFLKSLYEDGLIKFDFDNGSWECDISAVKALALTSDVIEFMALQLQKLPEATQNVLKLAACIGNQFDLTTLAIICEQSEAQTAADFWKALQLGLILPQSEVYKFYLDSETFNRDLENEEIVNYKFLHDRVQQAAYSLIPQEQKKATHIKIGRLLWQNTSSSQLEARVFAIANHLNIGIEHLHEPLERHKLIQLNLIAGKRAKTSTAYSSAITYLRMGIELLPSKSWQSEYNLTLSLYNEISEACYLGGEFDAMEEFAQEILQHAKSVIDTAKVYEVKIEAYSIQGKLFPAINTAMQFLHPIGIEFPDKPTDEDFALALQETQASLSGKTVASLADSPQMQNPELRAALRVLVKVDTPAYLAKPELHRLLVLKEVALCAKYGNTAASAFTYSVYGLMLCGQPDTISTGYEFGQLALQLLSKYQDKEYEARVLVVVHHFITHWKEPATATLKPLLQAYTSGLDSGDLAFAGYAAFMYGFHAYISGQELTKLANEFAIYEVALEKINQKTALNYNNIYYQSVLNLIDSKTIPWELVGAIYDETVMLSLHERTNDGTALWHLFVNKLMLSYLFQAFDLAVEYALKAKKYSVSGYAMMNIPLLNFYDSLLQLSLFSSSLPDEKQRILQQVLENQQIMQQWAHRAPMNHQHKYDLVDAEKCRVLGQKTQAIELYDKAIAGAKENQYIQEEALANELAAKFYLDWGKDKVAAGYMHEAYNCYAKWGAKAKTDDLEKRYPQLLALILATQKNTIPISETYIQSIDKSSFINQSIQTTRSSSTVCEALDFASLLKATQALSKEIQLKDLISTLLQILLENAGAEKAALVFFKDNILNLEAIATKELGVTHLSIPYETSVDIPKTLINFVKNSLTTVVLDNATIQNDFLADEYLIQEKPYSLLCIPILNQAKLIGLLYLENKLAIGAFTRERLEVINLLCSQTVISLENAQLHAQEKEKSYHLEQSQKRLKLLIQQTPVAVIEWDTDFNFQAWNPAAEKIFGYQAWEILGQHFCWIVPEEYRLYVDDIATQILAQNGGSHAINENLRKDGRHIFCEWFNAPIFNQNGQVCGGVSMVLDITGRKQAEEAVIEKSQELEQALQELNKAQLQMVQNEKMATLGNLVAGVAHEVNNPIGFLKGSISNAEEYIKDLFAHIECYQENYPNPEEELSEHAEDIDLEFISEDLPKLLSSMRLATERITDISNSLRTFSRADTSQKVACNIHEGIDSTILILKYRLKANDKRPAIEVIKEYGNLPPITCFLGQLNQVFMNIIANAIDALDTASQGKTFAEIKENPHKITIKTEVSSDESSCYIRIKDNGTGISEMVRERIFDNLFTTKGVGKGTGLGLAIARAIIEETHGGKISCNSKVGEGTEFLIQLPIRILLES